MNKHDRVTRHAYARPAPSAGQWTVQGPTTLPAVQALDAAPAVAALAIGGGAARTQLVRPFRALPLLATVGPGACDVMGYRLLVPLFSGLVIAGCCYFLQPA